MARPNRRLVGIRELAPLVAVPGSPDVHAAIAVKGTGAFSCDRLLTGLGHASLSHLRRAQTPAL
jgi:hypothetical protein